MRTALRILMLAIAYAIIGLGGDKVAAQFGHDWSDGALHNLAHESAHAAHEAPEAASAVKVEVRREGSRSCAFAEQRELTLDAGGIDRLNIDSGAGELRVEGHEGLDAIEIFAEACVSDEAWLEDVRLDIQESGSELTLTARYPERRNTRGNQTARLDLIVAVPTSMQIDIDDSAGKITVEGTGSVWIDDSSGSIEVEDVNGDVEIEDSSGSLAVSGVEGDVWLVDGSGSLAIREVGGSVTLRDGSGSIAVSDVGANVLVEGDGGGSIAVRNVGGDFTVESDGGGSIRHTGVAGTVDIPRRKRGN